MATIREVREIPLDDLVIGKAQVRKRDVGKDIGELAESIRVMGLLEPIVVAPAEKPGKFEIITGQRRFLAHKQLGRRTILAGVLDEKVDEATAKVLSVTENLVRRDLNSRDLIDVCTALYKKYGTIGAVAQETGLSQTRVGAYVKYDRLSPELKTLVDSGDVNVKTALRAQDAATAGGKYNPEEATKLALELSGMSGAQQEKLTKERVNSPDTPVDDLIESAKSGGKIVQITVTLGAEIHRALKAYAIDEDTGVDDAARELIEEGLSNKGKLEE
jgi:ParB family chromosome partitioning protein